MQAADIIGLIIAKGKYFSLNQAGATYSDGTFFFAGDRENTRTQIEAEDAGDIGQAEGQSKLTGGLKVDRKTGKQANGYTVKLAKESEAAVIELLKEEDKD